MLRITHLSDWHGDFPNRPLPEADIYICTGDMLPDFIKKDELDIFRTRALQGKFIRSNPIRELFPKETRDAPVLAVRGNHDWINLTGWFGGEVYEIGLEATVFDLFGYKFGGFRGIERIAGRWCDELDVGVGQAKMEQLPMELDFLVTHAPPLGILDSFARGNTIVRAGMHGLSNYVHRQLYMGGSMIGHFFGHIHEQHGYKTHPFNVAAYENIKPIGFSNAATGFLSYRILGREMKLTHEMGRIESLLY